MRLGGYDKMKSIKHIIKEGSCNHVLWYDNQGRHCSEVNCEINKKSNCKRKNYHEYRSRIRVEFVESVGYPPS